MMHIKYVENMAFFDQYFQRIKIDEPITDANLRMSVSMNKEI